MSSFNEKIFNVVSEIANNSDNPFKGKWVSILGDSISAYNGWVNGNSSQYPSCGVSDVKETWWHILLTRLGAKLCVNNSWAGRQVSESVDVERSTANAVSKLHRVKGETYINLDGTTETATKDINPDIILIFLGINDFNADVPHGELSRVDRKNLSFDSTNFAASYETMLHRITGTHYMNAKIYCLNMSYGCDNYGFLQANGGESKIFDYREMIEGATKEYECNCIHLDRLGVHQGNMSSYSTDKLHPNPKFMKMIANQCYNEMMASNCQ